MKVSPVARTESLIVKEVDGETLVYDLTTDKAHCLNETAARVWKNCDGRKNVSEISEALSVETRALRLGFAGTVSASCPGSSTRRGGSFISLPPLPPPPLGPGSVNQTIRMFVASEGLAVS